MKKIVFFLMAVLMAASPATYDFSNAACPIAGTPITGLSQTVSHDCCSKDACCEVEPQAAKAVAGFLPTVLTAKVLSLGPSVAGPVFFSGAIRAPRETSLRLSAPDKLYDLYSEYRI